MQTAEVAGAGQFYRKAGYFRIRYRSPESSTYKRRVFDFYQKCPL